MKATDFTLFTTNLRSFITVKQELAVFKTHPDEINSSAESIAEFGLHYSIVWHDFHGCL